MTVASFFFAHRILRSAGCRRRKSPDFMWSGQGYWVSSGGALVWWRSVAESVAMPKAVKLILACLVCLGVIIGLVLIYQRFF